MTDPVLLKDLLREKHWQTYRTFCRQYDQAAKRVDPTLVGSYPSRAQLHRWLSGDLKGLPYPHHCQVLEAMFPTVKVSELFEPSRERKAAGAASEGTSGVAEFLAFIEAGLDSPISADRGWNWEERARGKATLASAPSFPVDLAETSGSGSSGDRTAHIARAILMLGKRLRMKDAEVTELARLAGNLIDLEMECSIDIDVDGWATVAYRFEVLNLTNKPVKRMVREQWFETTSSPLKIEPSDSSDRTVSIQRMHETANMTKFACQFSPPIAPGEVGVIGYTTLGGRFTHDHYWRQAATRPVRHFTLSIRHQGASMLLGCTAIEDQLDGSQVSVIEDLVCADRDGDALMTITRDYLRAGQAVTLRWEVARAVS